MLNINMYVIIIFTLFASIVFLKFALKLNPSNSQRIERCFSKIAAVTVVTLFVVTTSFFCITAYLLELGVVMQPLDTLKQTLSDFRYDMITYIVIMLLWKLVFQPIIKVIAIPLDLLNDKLNEEVKK